MFYSQTFLARKGPLGTVWRAAHSHRGLQKSHYISTNVFSTAERIMYPEAPIALRLSAHLLLGIVRVYSKQVDYLHHDCLDARNFLMRACTSLKFNEPDPNSLDTTSTFRSPKRFKLDVVQVDEHSPSRSGEDDDRHVKSNKDITIPDSPFAIPVQNVVTSSIKATGIATSVPPDDSEFVPMDQDPVSLAETTENFDTHPAIDLLDDRIEPDPGLQERLNKDLSRSPVNIPYEVPEDDHHSKSTGDPVPPETEKMRDAVHDRGPGASIIGLEERVERSPVQLRKSDTLKSPTDIPPNAPLEMPSGGSDAFADRSSHGDGIPVSASQERYPVRESPEIALLDSPTGPRLDANEHPPAPQAVQHIVRQRKRKVDFYDEATVLTNEEMKESLRDTSNILRKKRLLRIDNLGVWKQQIRLKKDAVFSEPVLTGFPTDMATIFDPAIKHSRPRLIPTDEDPPVVPESTVPVTDTEAVPESPVRVVDDYMEIEHPRNVEESVNNPMSKLLNPSPLLKTCSSNTTMPSSSRRDIYTPTSIDTAYSEPFGRTDTPEFNTTPELTGSTIDPSTSTGLRQGRIGQYSPLSDIPESAESPRHLDFLEIDDNSLAGTPASVRVGEKEVLQFDMLPAATRAVGQYIKRQSTGTPNSEDSTLKLDSIVENKTKKISARMFFETLVLKSYGFVDVEQEEPYSEIKLKLTSKLKEQCSA